MEHREVKFALGALLFVFFLFGVLFRKWISYLFCPLANYQGRIGKGKSHYLMVVHFFISFGLSIGCYGLLNTNEVISSYFEDFGIRMLGIFAAWILFFYMIGLIIEKYLMITDADYKSWKQSK